MRDRAGVPGARGVRAAARASKARFRAERVGAPRKGVRERASDVRDPPQVVDFDSKRPRLRAKEMCDRAKVAGARGAYAAAGASEMSIRGGLLRGKEPLSLNFLVNPSRLPAFL
jgi:hypothetical protein